MAEEQQFCLRWNNFQANITSQFESLRDEEDFVDVTLACEGKRLRAHKVVLSACSPYFRELFKTNPCKHPILFMRDVEFVHLKSLVEFMYAGEVNVAQAELSTFLRTAESLQIRGLTEAPQKQKEKRKAVDSSAIASGSLKNNTKNINGKSITNDSSNELEEDVDLLPLSPTLSPRPSKKCKFEERLGPDTSIHLNPISNNHSDNRFPSTLNNYTSQDNTRPESENIYKSDNADLLEPKVEVPDYSSDGESKTGGFYGLDNSLDISNSFNNIQAGTGNFELLPPPAGSSAQNSHPNTQSDSTTPTDSSQADQRKLHSLDPRPCPICNRMYSNLSNLRQHVRLIHNPQTVACPLCSKPFKTKLYLKRHLISFHELVCTNPTGSNNGSAGANNNVPQNNQQPQQPQQQSQPQQQPVKGGDFYPPPPQVYLGPSNESNGGGFEGSETYGAKTFVETNNPVTLKENKQGYCTTPLRWEQPRPCPVCHRIYSNNSNLRRHMKSAHPYDLERNEFQRPPVPPAFIPQL